MAGLNPWLLAALGLLPPLAVPLFATAFGPPSGRLVSVQMLTTIGVLVLAALTFVLEEPSSIDLALALALLGLPASLLFAVALERWL